MAEHKHAEVLRAIADGKVVQWRSRDQWIDSSNSYNPLACPWAEWRVKPEPKPDVVRYVMPSVKYSGWADIETAQKSAFPEAKVVCKMVFDGETGKLKSVEIVE